MNGDFVLSLRCIDPRKASARFLAVLVAVVAVALATSNAAEAAWSVRWLDGAGGANGRIDADIRPDTANAMYAGELHVFYSAGWQGDDGSNVIVLRHAWRTGGTWRFETLDGAGGTAGRITALVGGEVAAASYGGRLHVLYTDWTNGDLRHGSFDGTSWNFETIDGAGGPGQRLGHIGEAPSVTIFGGRLQVFYMDRTREDLRRAVFDGVGWHRHTLDGAGGTNGRIAGQVGYKTSTAVYGKKLHVFYWRQDPNCDHTNPDIDCYTSLGHAELSGSAWRFEDISSVFVPGAIVTAVVSDTEVHVVFYEAYYGKTEPNQLKWVKWNGASWGGGPYYSIEGDSSWSFTAVSFSQKAHIFLTDTIYDANTAAAQCLYDGSWTGDRWSFECLPLDVFGFGSASSSRVLNSRIHLFLGGARPSSATGPPEGNLNLALAVGP